MACCFLWLACVFLGDFRTNNKTLAWKNNKGGWGRNRSWGMFRVSSFFGVARMAWMSWNLSSSIHLPPHFLGGGANRWMDGSLVAPDLSCSSSYRHLLALVVSPQLPTKTPPQATSPLWMSTCEDGAPQRRLQNHQRPAGVGWWTFWRGTFFFIGIFHG